MKHRRGIPAALLGMSAVMLLVSLWLVPTTHASDFRGGDTVTIAADEVVEDDLYVGANRLVVDGTVDGDVIASGTDIIINGTVTGDLLAAGQSVIINGTVEDDVRAAGLVLTLGPDAQVGDDVLSAGFSLEMQSGSAVGGDLTFFGGQAIVDGAIGGDLSASTASLAFNGSVAGDVAVEVGGATDQPPFDPFMFVPDAPSIPAVAPGLTVGDNAEVGGSVDVTVPDPAVAESVPADLNATVDVDESVAQAEPEQPNLLLDTVLEFFGRLLVLLIAALFVVWLAPVLLNEMSGYLKTEPWPSLGWGALLYFAIPFLLVTVFGFIVLLAVILGAIGLGAIGGSLLVATLATLGALLLAFALVLAFLAKVVVGYNIGKLIFGRLRPDGGGVWGALIVGLVIVALLVALPFIGWAANLIISIIGLGTLWLTVRGNRVAKADAVKATA